MKTALALAAILVAASAAQAQDYVKPYVRKDGTFVQGHYKTAPDSNRQNNYSSQGNTNPYTGQTGTVDPYRPQATPGYQAPPQQRCGTNRQGQYVCH